MEKVVIIGGARTPIGKYQGRLKSLSESDLCVITLKQLLEDTTITAAHVDEVVIGNAKQTSEPSNLARYAVLDADLPLELPAYTVQRHNASGMQALAKAYWSIKSGNSNVMIAGGSESMSQIPVEIQKARFVFNADTDIIFDPIKRQIEDAQPTSIYGEYDAASLADKIAEHYQFSADELTAYSKNSSDKAKTRTENLKRMTPIEIKLRKSIDKVDEDYVADKVPLVAEPADGAASLLVASATFAEDQEQPVLAEVLSIKTSAGNPTQAGLVDVTGVKAALAQAGLTLDEIDVIDLAETSAAYGLAFEQELAKLDNTDVAKKLNPYGGFLPSGVPGGGTSMIQCLNALDYLEAKGQKTAMIITNCDGGQTMVAIIRRGE